MGCGCGKKGEQDMTFEEWAKSILGDNPNWKESGDGELARQAYQAGRDDTALLRQALEAAADAAWAAWKAEVAAQAAAKEEERK